MIAVTVSCCSTNPEIPENRVYYMDHFSSEYGHVYKKRVLWLNPSVSFPCYHVACVITGHMDLNNEIQATCVSNV